MTVAASVKTQYEAVIGLETHCQLSTASKIFSASSTAFGSPPNSNIDPVCMGLPGTLPVLNGKVLEYAAKVGLALNCSIARYCKFDRKQYFYPDLPKNYQITQYDIPIAEHGWIEIEVLNDIGQPIHKRIGITRMHMEEDAGKLVHAGSDRLAGSTYSLVDYNRAGVPLVEIVSEPDLRTGQEAAEYAQELQRIVRYLGASDGNMQEGSMRCDVNISVRPVGSVAFGTKVEIKNMNSFNAIQRAIDYEFKRQVKAVEAGEALVQETRLWDENQQRTTSMRKKEGSSDYRYFPEPDLMPVRLTETQLQQWSSELPELPAWKRTRYQEEFGLSAYDARYLSDDQDTAAYFEATLAAGADPKAAANWIMSDVANYLNTHKLTYPKIAFRPDHLAELVSLIKEGTISGKIAKEILPELMESGGSVRKLVESKGVTTIADPDTLNQFIDEILADNPKQLEQYRGGKSKLFGFFVGQMMKKTGGRAEPQVTNDLLKQKLDQP